MGTHIISRWCEATAGWVNNLAMGALCRIVVGRSRITSRVKSRLFWQRYLPSKRPGTGFGNALSDASTQWQLRIDAVAQS